VLAAVRGEVGRRIASGGPADASLTLDEVAARLEEAAADRAVLDRAAAALDGGERGEPETGARARRERRRAAAHRAAGELVLGGLLVMDGPGRVRLPGFGRTTWRAVAALRAAGPEAPPAWAAAVAAEPASDLGAAAPAFLAGLPRDHRLAALAARLHAAESARQDARHALLMAGTALGAAAEGGGEGLRILRDDIAALDDRIRRLDATIDAIWDAGAARAARLP
jgi:pyruvate/2-oxoglutarate dehydrogenase complex dihydrolipoamide acyltransferase (E2) component